MRFYFDAPNHEAGFVWLRLNYNARLEVTSGLGSERKVATLTFRKNPETEEAQERMCRQAVAQYLNEMKGSSQQFSGSLDETLAPWAGELRPVPPKRLQ